MTERVILHVLAVIIQLIETVIALLKAYSVIELVKFATVFVFKRNLDVENFIILSLT